MGLLDCVASPEGRDEFDEDRRPVPRPKQLSRSDHDISRRRALPLFSSQTSLKNVRDVDFWRQKVLRFLYSPEGYNDIRMLRVPLKQLGFTTVTDFISEIPIEIFQEYEDQGPPHEGIFKDYKVVWIKNGIAESGLFKWQGVIENVTCIGLQLDRKKAVPFGVHDGRGLFTCKPGHRAILPATDEILPYKKFLRTFLGIPQRRDSLNGSVRRSAKEIAARNAKTGDRVYLPKERKWATVQWTGQIENETVFDLIYDRPKPEAGKPVSPDEPCMSRSLSLADFIEELESEPNTPKTPLVAHPTQLTVTATVERHAVPPPPQEIPPMSPLPKSSVDQNPSHEDGMPASENDDDDDDDESDDDDDDDEGDDDDVSATASESELSILDVVSDHELEHVRRDDMDKTPSPSLIKSYPGMENFTTAIPMNEEGSPKLQSPKRKGFFGFTKQQKKRPQSPSPIRKPEPELSDAIEPELDEITPQPISKTQRSKSPNFFSNFKIGKSKPKRDKNQVQESAEDISETKPKYQKKKAVNIGWGDLFKSQSKQSLTKHTVDDPMNRVECSTPIDDMIPPDKIPTPPPDTGAKSPPIEKFNERLVGQSEYFNFHSQPTNDVSDKGSSVQSPLTLPPKSIHSADDVVDIGKDKVEPLSPVHQPVQSESETSESEDEVSVQQVDNTSKEHEMPPVPVTPLPQSESDSESEVFESETEYRPVSPTSIQVITSESRNVNIPRKVEAPQAKDPIINTATATPVYYLEKFKESKVRNKSSSFGSFLARIKNPKRKPDGSLQSPRSPIPNELLSAEENPEGHPQVSPNYNDTSIELNRKNNHIRGSPSVSSMEQNDNEIGDMQLQRSLVRPKLSKDNSDGNQDGILLDLLDVQESLLPINSPPPGEIEKSPKRKAGRGRTFSFTFSRKRKSSNKETEPSSATSDAEVYTNENMHPSVDNLEMAQSSEVLVKERKQSNPSSFRNSFKRTFSLTRKKQSSTDLWDEQPISPPATTITRPRPVTLYIDNNEALAHKNSFRNKRPTSVHVDIQPWNSRRGVEGVDIYSSPDATPNSAGAERSPANPALDPKEPVAEIPKHRVFTTPSIFLKNKKVENVPTTPKYSSPPYTKLSYSEDNGNFIQSQTTSPHQVASPTSPTLKQPPPLPAAPPPVIKRQPRFVVKEQPGPIVDESSKTRKSSLKQRKSIEMIPKGLRINDRVLWYSARGPVPGTVQKLFKDGTDKYTAMVKFDREVTDEPLRLTREGDAYMITVEELITPDMFGQVDTQVQVTPPTPTTPGTPSVRFDGVASDKNQLEDGDDSDSDLEGHDMPPPFQEEEVSMACGFRRGIQSQDKSCCLETILFSLFYTTNAFDISMLYANTRVEDAVTRNTRRILRKEIVDPLRRDGFCAWKAVKKLRDAVKPLSNEWQTLSTDAEVMMFILFDRALKLGKFISYSNDMSDYLHQLVVDPKDLSKSTTVQHLFENSLKLMEKLKLTTVPTPALILEMPRSNDKLMQYKAVVPNLTLHISHIMENGPRLCICGMVAKYDCRICTANVGKMSIVYCDSCKGTADIIHFQLPHEVQLSPLNQPTILLDLVAILCVKAGHYFSFVKCGNQSLSPWVYFDGSEIENPKVCIEQNLSMWLERLEKYPGRYQDALEYPLLSNILQDSHICIYQPREKSSSV